MDTYTERVAHATEGAEDTFVENQKEFSYQSLSKYKIVSINKCWSSQ